MRLIDADELLNKIKYKPVPNILNETWNELYERVLDEIDNAPTVEPIEKIGAICNENCGMTRPHGKWIKIFSNPFTDGYVCPFCGHKIQVTEQFLPKVTECEVCGAEMKGWRDVETPQASNNAELFKQTFGIYATELWSMKEADFLEWLNGEYER